jgi:radical SAM protein with 4Fe4S-binding SPASM domain
LLDNWSDILSLIHRYLPKTQVVIPTNGSKLGLHEVKELCKFQNVRIINFSINAYFEETYQSFMGLPAKVLDLIHNAIKLIILLRPDIKIWVSMVADPEYQTDLERDLFKSHWDGIADNVWLLSASSAGRTSKRPLQPVTAPCRSIFSDIVVGYDGKLTSCCFNPGMDLDLGYYSGDLKKDWRNPKLEDFRRIHNEHRRAEIPLCRGCTFA